MAEHLYIHVPFCDGKCHYCGFYSIVACQSVVALYSPLPAEELGLLLEADPAALKRPATLYIGGGTPSMLGADGLKRLADALSRRVPLDALEEWTVELNPASVSPALLEALKAIGVNRLSIGVQSFDDTILLSIGRRHDAAAAVKAVALALDSGFDNTGIDLIAGLPGSTQALWQATLERALSMPLKHVSVYALSLEPGTPLAVQAAKGAVMPSDEEQLAALAQAEGVLGQAGFGRYEISNYAIPGYECRHNLGIWRGNDYVGLGPAAASRLNRKRWTNTEDLSDYMEALGGGRRPAARQETLDDREDATERALFALRLSEGIDPDDVARRFPALRDQASAWEERLAGLARHGITEKGGRRWRLTPRGREVCDAVLRELI